MKLISDRFCLSCKVKARLKHWLYPGFYQYGIPAPLTSELVYPQCLLIPCVAIDLDGYRLGYGGGWYDRILSGQHFDLTIGVVPACFVCRALAHETYDRALSGWVCENGFTWVVKPSCG